MYSSIKLVLMLVAGAVADYDGGYSTDFGNNQLSGGYSGGGYSDGGGHSGGSGYSGGGGYSGGSDYTGGSGYSGGSGYTGGNGYTGDSGHTGGGTGIGGHEEEHHQAHPYEFGYAVKDPHHGTDFGQQESSDGHNVKGSYRVVLPDGRTQIVTYHADWKTGFHADVRYEGTAQYPEAQHGGSGSGNVGGTGSYGYPSQDLGGQDYAGHEHGFSGYSR